MIIDYRKYLGIILVASVFVAGVNAQEPKKAGALIYLCGEENTSSIGTATLVEKPPMKE